MEKKEDILENFKTALTSTARSISNIDNLEVTFGTKEKDRSKIAIQLPELESKNNKINYTKMRALADSEALRARYSDEKIFKKHQPSGNISKKLYSIAEKIRYEKIGSLKFKGIKENIHNYYNERLSGLDLSKNDNKMTEAFENYLRVNILDLKNNKFSEKEFKLFKKDFDAKIKNKITSLRNSLKNQIKFNNLVSELITVMNIDEDPDNGEIEQ